MSTENVMSTLPRSLETMARKKPTRVFGTSTGVMVQFTVDSVTAFCRHREENLPDDTSEPLPNVRLPRWKKRKWSGLG